MDKTVTEIIHAAFVNIAEEVSKKSEMEVPCFLHRFMAILALEIYEQAPSISEAERLFQDAIGHAKKIHLESK